MHRRRGVADQLEGVPLMTDQVQIKDRVEMTRRPMTKTPCGECHLNSGEKCDICGARRLTAVQRAYALLWRCKSDDRFVNQARRELLETMTRDDQREAVNWVVEEFGPMQTNELIAADMRASVFPQRSYDPS